MAYRIHLSKSGEAHEAVTTALEFQLHLVAGCDFPNSSEVGAKR